MSDSRRMPRVLVVEDDAALSEVGVTPGAHPTFSARLELRPAP